MKSNGPHKREIFTTGARVSDSRGWIFSLIRLIRESFEERQSPVPREKITAAPVEIQEIWTKTENHIPGLLSILAHVSVVTALIVLSVVSDTKPKPAADNSVLLEPSALSLPSAVITSGGGGGGGTKAPTLASRGILPKASDKQFVPPTPIVTNLAPELIAEPTIIALQLMNLPGPSSLIPIGYPQGVVGPPSSGKGSGGGVGDEGNGHGVGSGEGPGFGPGKNGGTGGDGPQAMLRPGTPGLIAPMCITVEPNYSDDARRARIQGTVRMAVTIQKDGSIEFNKVLQSLGYGLDDEARTVLSKWKCNPAKYYGQEVAVPMQIDMSFHLWY